MDSKQITVKLQNLNHLGLLLSLFQDDTEAKLWTTNIVYISLQLAPRSTFLLWSLQMIHLQNLVTLRNQLEYFSVWIMCHNHNLLDWYLSCQKQFQVWQLKFLDLKEAKIVFLTGLSFVSSQRILQVPALHSLWFCKIRVCVCWNNLKTYVKSITAIQLDYQMGSNFSSIVSSKKAELFYASNLSSNFFFRLNSFLQIF